MHVYWVESGCIEIRQLESDRQALVYNHHHELIAANDTIRAVRPLFVHVTYFTHHNYR